MDSQSHRVELLGRLAPTWPSEWQDLQDETDNPVRHEIRALLAGGEAHLPYFRGNQVAWLTVAANATALRAAIAGLRAWVIPSFAWEDRVRPILQPNDYQGPLAEMLRAVSPTGYYRWHSRSLAARGKILEKLALWRKVSALRPPSSHEVAANLFELREQFQLALATGDRTLAEASVAAIDEEQLDTASNTAFMRTQMRARFGCYGEIVSDPNLSRMLALNVPRSVRTAIIDAFYETFVRRPIELSDAKGAVEAFRNSVLPHVQGLFLLARPEDSEGTRWFLAQLANAVTPTPPEPPKSSEQIYFDALRRSDWRCVQEVGLALLNSERESPIGVLVQTGLIESLSQEPNPELASRLNVFEQTPLPAQNWSEFLDCIRDSSIQRAGAFLALPERPSLQLNDHIATRKVVSGIEEFLTSPNLPSDGREAVLAHSLASLVEDLVGDREYPRCDLAEVYLTLLQLWVSTRNGSLLAGDSNVVISLATGVLQCQRDEEAEVARLLRTWWESRPVKAKLPFVLESLDLLGELSTQVATAQGLWIDGVTFIGSRAVALTRTEGTLWRSLGRKLGFDASTVVEYLATDRVPADAAEPEDPLAGAGLKKVAIVSLHSRSAQGAAQIIHDRSNAAVIVVDGLVAGPATDSARTAEVVLLVWAATKHAVYRAFDDVREKVVYVQGTGMSSIVLALERWLMSAHSAGTGD